MSDESSANQPIDEKTETHCIKNDAKQEHTEQPQAPTIPVPSIISRPCNATDSDQHHKNPSKNWRKNFEFVFKIFELVTFISIIFTTLLLYRQVKDAKDTRMTDERAWVSNKRVFLEY